MQILVTDLAIIIIINSFIQILIRIHLNADI